jgi:hypothetical protein
VLLNPRRIADLQRAQQQPFGCAFGIHAQILPTLDRHAPTI